VAIQQTVRLKRKDEAAGFCFMILIDEDKSKVG
jgi:hypothetical protein